MARVAAACSCNPAAYAPLCQRIDNLKVLFVGTAVETNDNHDGFIKGGILYRFSVEEPFKGLDRGVAEVIVDPASGTSCQEEFTVGKRYLVSSYGDGLSAKQAAALSIGGFPHADGNPRASGPLVVTGVCSGSREIESAADDIAFLRQYMTAPLPSRIFGFVRIHANEYLWNDRYPPLPGASITIGGAAGNRTVITDKNGHYELSDVSPGEYVVTAGSPGFASTHPTYTVEVPARGCGVANIGMFSQGSIGGKVIEQDGRPAVGVDVEYIHSDPKIAGPSFAERFTKTDQRGEFRFTKVPPGDFLVGVHIDVAPTAAERILPVYWPSGADESEARIVHLSVNQRKDDLVIKLGPRASLRKLLVRVEWPDGSPAASTKVHAMIGGTIAELAETDAAGAVEMPLLNGVEYSLGARAWTSYREVHGNRIGENWVDTEEKIFPRNSSLPEVILVLNRPRPKR